jgi:predicted nucleic acid-binding protein
VCVTHDNTYGPPPLPSDNLLDLLRRIADQDDAPNTVQADAREYLRYLEAASAGSGPLTGAARLTLAATAAQHGREVVQRVPRPR